MYSVAAEGIYNHSHHHVFRKEYQDNQSVTMFANAHSMEFDVGRLKDVLKRRIDQINNKHNKIFYDASFFQLIKEWAESPTWTLIGNLVPYDPATPVLVKRDLKRRQKKKKKK